MQELSYREISIKTKLKSWGNSYGLRVSKKDAEKIGISPGDTVRIEIKQKRISGFGICKGMAPFKRDKDDRF